jgi:DNA-binding transcriptional regulator YbjK
MKKTYLALTVLFILVIIHFMTMEATVDKLLIEKTSNIIVIDNTKSSQISSVKNLIKTPVLTIKNEVTTINPKDENYIVSCMA